VSEPCRCGNFFLPASWLLVSNEAQPSALNSLLQHFLLLFSPLQQGEQHPSFKYRATHRSMPQAFSLAGHLLTVNAMKATA